MSRRRASTEAGVSLFPFLAVLVCLIGSLILLLILVSRQSRANALARAKQARVEAAQAAAAAKPKIKRTAPPRPASTPDPEAAARRKEEEREAAELEEALRQAEAAQAEARRAAEEGRAILSHLEDHIRQLQDDAQKLNVAESSLAKKLGDRGFTKQQLEKELASLRAAEKEKEDAIREAKEAAGKRKAFAIIPYEGPNGTRREPIYLECRGDRIILQPDGVVFPAGDFSGPVGPQNPLAATVRAINEYREQRGVDRTSRPYPLMLVRPDGVGAYYAARVALEGWDDEFGYELIDADLLLAFPQVDSERTALAKRAAEEARYRQAQLAKIAPSLFNGGGGGMAKAGSAPRRFRVSPTGQGIIPDDSGSVEADEEPLFPKGRPSRVAAMKAEQAAAAGSAFNAGGPNVPGGRNGQGGMGLGAGDGTNGDGTGGYGTGNGPGGGRPGFSNAGVASVRGGSGYGPGGTGSAFGGANGGGGPNGAAGPNGTSGGAGSGGPNAFGGTAPGQGTGGAFGGPDGMGNASAGNGAGGQGGQGGGGPNGSGAPGGNGSPDGNNQLDGAPGQGTLYGDLAARGDPGGTGMTNNGSGGGADAQGRGPGGQGGGSGNGSGGGPGGGAASGGAQAGGQGGSSGGGGQAGGQAGGGQQAGGASAGGGDPNQGGAGAPSFVFSDGRNANASGGRSGGQSGGTPPSGSPPPGGQPPSSYEPRYGEFVESIASRKGEGWAVGGPQGGSIAVRREVRVNLSRDLMKLAASGKEIPLDRGSVPAMEKLAKEIQTQIKAWGVAGRGMHWRPSLVFEVEPSAEERYLEIDQLLVGSGMEVRTVRPITNRTAVGRPPYEARNPAAVPPR